jgi:glycerol-3-phosphate acyltransferase PlsY
MFPSLSSREIIVILASYGLGCFTSGYYLVRLTTGKDIRRHGSGAVGARNVGRELGAPGFLLTFLVDFAKGAVVVWAAYYFGLSPGGVVAAMNAVVMGHVWPLQLGFRGGKGIATALGAILVLDSRLTLLMLLLFVLMLAVAKQLTVIGIILIILSPLLAATMGSPESIVWGLTVLATIVLIAHRRNIREIFRAKSHSHI